MRTRRQCAFTFAACDAAYQLELATAAAHLAGRAACLAPFSASRNIVAVSVEMRALQKTLAPLAGLRGLVVLAHIVLLTRVVGRSGLSSFRPTFGNVEVQPGMLLDFPYPKPRNARLGDSSKK